MAHFARTVHKGNGGSGGAAARVQYICREGLYAPARVAHQSRESGGERLREDCVHHEARNLPAFAQKDAIEYFSAAEKYETRTAYEEWKFTVPRDLSRPQQMDAARDFLQASFGTRHPYVWALHDTKAADGGRNVHVHAIWSGRTLDAHERSPKQFFRRHNAVHPERGGAAKARGFSHMGSVKAFRVMHSDIMNLHLERAGLEVRLHPEKLSERGFDRTPEPRLRIKDSNAYKRGIVTERMQAVLDHRQARAPQIAAEQRQARMAWTERKFNLGIVRAMTHEQAMERICEARMYAVTHGPNRAAEREQRHYEIQELEYSLTRDERTVKDLAFEHRLEQMAERTGQPRSRESQARVERVLARATEQGIALTSDVDLDRRWDRPLIGHTQSKIYHTPEHKNYGDVTPGHQRWFWSEREAQDAGYRRAQNDHYGRGTGKAMEERARTQPTPEQRPDRPSAPRRPARLLDVDLTTHEPDEAHGQGVKVRIFDRDRERGGWER